MHPYLELAVTVLFWLLYPIYWIAYLLVQAVLYILHPLYGALLFLLQPIIFAGVFIAQLAYLPIDLVARFETIYIYLGVGSFVGIIAGVLLHLNISFLTSVLGLKHSSRPRSTYRHREPARRQAPNASKPPEVSIHESQEQPREASISSDSTRLFALPKLTLQGPSPEGSRRRTLLDQTLDEDDDSEI